MAYTPERKYMKSNLPATFLSKAKELSAESKWLVQPTAVTFMRYDYTLLQSKIFVRIICALQDAIQEAIHNHYNGINEQLSIFTSAEYESIIGDPNKITLRLPINSFGVSKTQYKQLKAALSVLASIPVEIPFKGRDGKDWVRYTNLCNVEVPKTYQVTNVYVNMEKETALHMLNLDFGFTRYFCEVILQSKCAYTPRLYTYLSVFLNEGGTKWKMDELRKYLRLKDDQYSYFRDFRKRILDAVKVELKEKFDEGISNFYYEYDVEYNAGRKKYGTPDAIVFKIISRELLASDKEALNIKKKSIYDLLRSDRMLLDERFANAIVERVTFQNHLAVLEKIMELHEIISKPDNGILHKNKYIYSSIMKLFDEDIEADGIEEAQDI